jgi:hypothetical protein
MPHNDPGTLGEELGDETSASIVTDGDLCRKLVNIINQENKFEKL